MSKKRLPQIFFIMDGRGWVQEQRAKILIQLLPEFRFRLLSKDQFSRKWNRGGLRGQPIYFASWRIPFQLLESGRCAFHLEDYQHFMASVTSHYNIGGGLDPTKAVRMGRDPEVSFDKAVSLLKGFQVITANSKILYHMLAPHIENLYDAPNGVDTNFFTPSGRYQYQPENIRIGWVGKLKAAKNYEALQEVREILEGKGFTFYVIAHPKNVHRRKVYSPEKMRKFYHQIDYYLCTSWHEGTPNPALEAAACGAPVVATRVGNMPELIEHGVNGYFVDPTPASTVAQLEALRILSSSEYHQMRAVARERIVFEWAWENRMPSYRQAFLQLLG